MTNPFIDDAAERISWREPEPLNTSSKVPSFPTDALPTRLGEFLKAVSAYIQVKDEMTGPAILGALSTAVQGRFIACRRNGSKEQVNLYTLIVSEPGTRKSPVEKAVTQPLRDLEAELQEEAHVVVNRARRDRDLLERQVQTLLDKAKNGNAESEAEYRAASERLDNTPVPTMPRLITGEITPERVPDLASTNGQALAIAAAEGGVLGTFLGRYNGGTPNVDMLTAGYSGDAITIDRKGRDPVPTQGLALTLLIFLQPASLRDLFIKLGEGTQGVSERFLISVPSEVIGKRETDQRMPKELTDWYSQHLKAIATYCRKMTERVELQLSDEAAERFRVFQDSIYPMTETGGAWSFDPLMKGWGAKLGGTTLRIAALLHVSHEIEKHGRVSSEISDEAMSAAEQIAVYYAEQHKRVARIRKGKTELDDAERVLAVIKQNARATVTARDIMRSSSLKVSHDALEVLRVLEEHGYLAEIEQPRRPGRKSPVFAVNPRVLGTVESVNLGNPVTN